MLFIVIQCVGMQDLLLKNIAKLFSKKAQQIKGKYPIGLYVFKSLNQAHVFPTTLRILTFDSTIHY